MSKVPPEDPRQPLKAPPPKAKNKPSHGGPATKAEHAALKRVDKMVIKRMRKR
jgi:hypothetical protein